MRENICKPHKINKYLQITPDKGLMIIRHSYNSNNSIKNGKRD